MENECACREHGPAACWAQHGGARAVGLEDELVEEVTLARSLRWALHTCTIAATAAANTTATAPAATATIATTSLVCRQYDVTPGQAMAVEA